MSQIPTRDELDALAAADAFIGRHIAPDASGIADMLDAVGAASLEALAAQTVPAGIRIGEIAGLPTPADEHAVLDELRALARQNVVARSLIGAGYHGTRTPPVILRNVLENPGWYTAYTPYQAEIAQGRLEALLNFQTLICELTGLPVANASLLDEATAAAEAVAMARAASKAKASRTVAVSADLHPQTRAVIATRMEPLGITLAEVAPGNPDAIAQAAPFAVVLSYPGTTGEVRDLRAEIDAAHAAGTLAIVCADPLALVLLTPPGEMGADVVVGSSQRFGVPMGFGGPHAAFFATTEANRRLMPGRIVGVSVDAAGAAAMRLALQTREQHIRREKATSNICTAQVLLAVIAGFYAVWHGPEGLRRIARRVNLHARLLAAAARAGGHDVQHDSFFDTITLSAAPENGALYAAAREAGFNLRLHPHGALSISLDETVTVPELKTLIGLLGGDVSTLTGSLLSEVATSMPLALLRGEDYLEQGVFNAHHSEHAMLRYLKRLEDRDVALNRSMIPLGSCTMKLNATAEMMAITWPEFADIHPFAPAEQTRGYLALIDRLSGWLAAATGFAAVSLQPNAGSQGEYAGLLAIRAYHRANGQQARDICLIPSSAHGTNPASAAMAGMRVVVVACTRDGDVDVADLETKIAQHGEQLAALMITYPSTHGVFEEQVRRICELVHAHGGQVYMDGANMNAQLGLTSPGEIGADVCHLNLHKTFCIPHGGGGPGIGPIGVAAHLIPYLPGHPVLVSDGHADDSAPSPVGPVSAAPYGSAMILPISYAYIRMMGAVGLKRASEVAILSANYIAGRLASHYPVLYRGARGMVAHECIIDCRGFEASANTRVEDIAKRLQDYGFHAPTMSWPVPGTLMIEPTESEPKDEIDRFCDAMIAIRAEIAAIEAGDADRSDNVLRNAPHTASEIADEAWAHPYSRVQAVFPLPFVRATKYWPPVKRVDNAYGDRNLVCTCAPLEAYAEA